MAPTPIQSIIWLLMTVMVISVVGAIAYFLCKKIHLPTVVTFFIVSFGLSLLFSLSFGNPGRKNCLILMATWVAFSIIGAVVEAKSTQNSSPFSKSFFVMGLANFLTFFIGLASTLIPWILCSLIFNFDSEKILPFSALHIDKEWLVIAFVFVAPTLAAAFFGMVRNYNLRPGIDKPLSD